MQFDEIQEIFFQECEEGLAAAEVGLMACKAGDREDETINTIFRAVHSIKGGAGAFGFTALQGFTHKFETVLDLVRSHELPLTDDLVGIMLKAFDVLADHITAAHKNDPKPNDVAISTMLEAVANRTLNTGSAPATASVVAPPAPVVKDVAPPLEESLTPLDFSFDDLLETLGDTITVENEDLPIISSAPTWTLHVRPGAGALANGGEPLLLLREMLNLGALLNETNVSAVPALDAFDPAEVYLGWSYALPMTVSSADVREIFDFIMDSCDLLIEGENGDEMDQDHGVDSAVEQAMRSALGRDIPEATIVDPVTTPATADTNDQANSALAAPVVQEVAKAVPSPVTGQSLTNASQTIRVDLEKLDRLVNLVGELVITQAMLAQKLLTTGVPAMSELTDLDQLTRELQDSAMSIRAQPIKSVFSRVPRIVRELEAETGKKVQLDIEGEMTELDKTVVERIGEPLTHLIRNAIDHGLETPEKRLAAGKSEVGVLKLSAEHKSGRILICVSDDGGGINREKVRAKAIERGLIGPETSLTDEEIDNLIFAPGFSTADVVSNISGRGVGMDVVRSNVEALGGRISITSRPGHGSVFTLALPLTLAILDGMIVTSGDQTFVIPLTNIIESLRPQPSELRSLGNGRQMLDVRGTFLPIHPVSKALGISGAEQDPTEAVLIVVDSDITGRCVLMVDEIRDQRQVVIKSLETNYRPVKGLAGATILGDGRVALILDVEALASMSAQTARVARLAA